jgi:hypothetical protein
MLCTQKTSLPCDLLLTHFEAIVSDKDHWPDHLCPSVMQASTVRWIRE